MGLRDELADELRGVGGRCLAGEWLAQQDDAEWRELFADAAVPHSALYRLMRKHGWQRSDQPIARHRTGKCACDRAT